MSRDLDTRARRAAESLTQAVDAAEFTVNSPAAVKTRRPLVAVLRPAIAMALLMIGAAVGGALVTDSDSEQTPVPTTVPLVPTSLAETTPSEPEPAPPTTAYVPPTTATTTAPTTTVASDLEAPFIEITSPEEGAEFEEKTIAFEGVTEPGAKVAAGRWEADVDDSGNWRIVLVLSEGKNTARFTATDEAGNSSEATVTVFYVPAPETTTTTIEEKEHEFSAFATFGSCSETPPYDIYYGTGKPGTVIQITSDYGSGSVEVSENGEWEKKVVFETAPPDKAFLVKVADEFGNSKKFEMIYQPA